ncbi:DNA polymerase III subunit alpha [Chryseolinea sp. T2]|uniref:DNA polymerase III subunit alpha n=1 Tax=Chryseolinea sp. T2 TaxID=3129255 RepID=UPI003077D71D
MYLNTHSAYSFKYGTMQVKDLFEEARRCGVRKLILTDINNTAAYIEMIRYCNEQRPVKGSLNRFGDEGYDLQITVGIEIRKGNELLYILIARNNKGFEKINRFLSFHNLNDRALPMRAPEIEDSFVVYPFRKVSPEQLRINEFIGVQSHELGPLMFHEPYRDSPNKFVAWQPVTFAGKRDFNTHRLLRAIHHNTLLSKLQSDEHARPDEIMIPINSLKKKFAQFPDLIVNAERIVAESSIHFDLRTDKNLKCFGKSAGDDWTMLKQLTWKGFERRYPARTKELDDRIERELRVIQSKGFCAYYLVAHDLVTFATQRGFPFVGRGSGANSVVAYCLGITNVDPIELDLYFERFLNDERSSPPDFDIDFSWDNRDAIYEYIFNRYPKDHVCLLATHVTYQRRSMIRELGKVFGLPKEEIEDLVENPSMRGERDDITGLIMQYAERIKDLPSNISIHAGGVLITDKPIFAYTALDLPPKGYPVSQFEMHNAEDMGIFKFDILSQRGLGHLKESVLHVKRNRGIDVDLDRFSDFKDDDGVKAILRESRAMGCFYVESPAMRMLLAKLRCDDYITLVAASSIIRPGVARSGMMRAYIERFHAVKRGEGYTCIHPTMDTLLKETYGVMVYQEDVIKVANQFAGLSLTEADVIRKGMSGKYRSRQEFFRVREGFFKSCRDKGYSDNVIDRVWYEIESFSGYSFAKGHSASYAVESYQSLYMKAHYPLEFMVGVINNFGGFYRTEFYFHEARMLGARILAPCVNHSERLTTIHGDNIFIGFIHLKGLEEQLAKKIVTERLRAGAYTDMENFLERIATGLEQVRILIRVGSFQFTGKSKQRLLWEAMLYFGKGERKQKAVPKLFDTEPKAYPLPALERHELEDAFEEIELLGFPLCDPFLLLNTTDRGDSTARDLTSKIGSCVHIVGYLVATKDTSTTKGESMHFGTFNDMNGDVFDTVHFPDVAKRCPFRGRGFYGVWGRVTEDFGVPALEVTSMEKLPLVNKRAEEFLRESVYEEKSKL